MKKKSTKVLRIALMEMKSTKVLRIALMKKKSKGSMRMPVKIAGRNLKSKNILEIKKIPV